MPHFSKAKHARDGDETASGSEAFEKRILLLPGLDNAGKAFLLHFMRYA